MPELREQDFDFTVVKDATAALRHPVWGDRHAAAFIAFNYLANAVLSTDEVIDAIRQDQP